MRPIFLRVRFLWSGLRCAAIAVHCYNEIEYNRFLRSGRDATAAAEPLQKQSVYLYLNSSQNRIFCSALEDEKLIEVVSKGAYQNPEKNNREHTFAWKKNNPENLKYLTKLKCQWPYAF